MSRRGNWIGFASVNFGGVVIDDLRLRTGKTGFSLGAPSKPDPASRTDTGLRFGFLTEPQERITAAECEAYHAAVEQLVARPRRYGLPRSRSRWPRLQSKREKENGCPPAPAKAKEARITDSRTLGDKVSLKEGLLSWMALRACAPAQTYVDMLLTDPPYGTTSELLG